MQFLLLLLLLVAVASIVFLYGCVNNIFSAISATFRKKKLFVFKANVIGEYGIDSILNAAFSNGVEPF